MFSKFALHDMTSVTETPGQIVEDPGGGAPQQVPCKTLTELYKTPSYRFTGGTSECHIPEKRLQLIIVGHNPSNQSYIDGHFYSNPSNRMWRLLKDAEIVPPYYSAVDDEICPIFEGIGFTDLLCGVPDSKSCSFSDAEMRNCKFDLFRRLTAHCQRVMEECHVSADLACPQVIAFAGSRQWKALFPAHYFTQRKKKAAVVAPSKNRIDSWFSKRKVHDISNDDPEEEDQLQESASQVPAGPIQGTKDVVNSSAENAGVSSPAAAVIINNNGATLAVVEAAAAVPASDILPMQPLSPPLPEDFVRMVAAIKASEAAKAAAAAKRENSRLIPFGVQTYRPDGWPPALRNAVVFVLPSPSGAAALSNEERQQPYNDLKTLLVSLGTWDSSKRELVPTVGSTSSSSAACSADLFSSAPSSSSSSADVAAVPIVSNPSAAAAAAPVVSNAASIASAAAVAAAPAVTLATVTTSAYFNAVVNKKASENVIDLTDDP
jgi:G:T/U-mismatch repair DNA glycosylase